MKPAVIIGLIFLTTACAQQKSDADQAANIRGGRCFLTKDGHNHLCMDFNQDSDSNADATACTAMLSSYLGSYTGSRGQDFLSGNANTCASNTSDTVVGRCTKTDGVISYYTADWSAGTSQADCTAVSGTWSTP